MYGGITSTAIELPPPLRCCSCMSSSTVIPESEYAPAVAGGKKLEMMNEKIFPWTGNLTDLHDPQVVWLDQTSCNYPLWMIQKVLLVCSMDTVTMVQDVVEKTGDDDDGYEKEHDRLAQREPEDSTIPLLEKLRWEQCWHRL